MMVILFYLVALVPHHRAHGCSRGKEIMEIIHLLTAAISIQIIVDAIVHMYLSRFPYSPIR